MEHQSLTYGGLFFQALGAGFVWYVLKLRASHRKIVKRLTLVPINSILVRIILVEKGDRYRWTEYAPAVEYKFTIENQDYSGNNIYIEGDISYENKGKAEKHAAELKCVNSIYCDCLHPQKLSSVNCNISPAYSAHLTGLLASGIVLFTVGILLFVIGY